MPGFGGLHVELSSTAMVGLGEGARYLVEYPYGCAEQRGSRALALLLAADLGDAFSLPGIDTAKMRPAAQQTLKELEKFQCRTAGSPYWPGACASHVAVSHRVPAARVQDRRGPEVSRSTPACAQRAYAYLERELARDAAGERRLVAVLHRLAGVCGEGARRGRPQPGLESDPALRLSRSDAGVRARLPARRAGRARSDAAETAARVADLRRRMANAILAEAGSAHVEELSDPYLLWFWNSNVRSTAIVLNSLVKASVGRRADPPDGALDDGGHARTAAGATRRRTPARWKRSSPTTASTRARRRTSGPWSGWAPRSSRARSSAAARRRRSSKTSR